MSRSHRESHFIARIGWLRAAVLGANKQAIPIAGIAGIAGLVAGAMSMAAGEYVSVSSQSDAETPTWRASGLSSRPTSSSRNRNWPTSMSDAGFSPIWRGKWPSN